MDSAGQSPDDADRYRSSSFNHRRFTSLPLFLDKSSDPTNLVDV